MRQVCWWTSYGLVCILCAGDGAWGADPVADSQADFYVAPAGDDRQPGTLEQPLATLARARDLVRERQPLEPPRDWRVLLRGGSYALRQAVVFQAEDAAAEGHSITYAAYPGERPVLRGAVPIAGWRVTDQGRWEADLAQLAAGGLAVEQLFINGQRRPRARHPNHGYLRVAAGSPASDTQFTFAAGDLEAAAVTPGSQLIFLHDWSISRVAVDRLDETSQTIFLRDRIGAQGPAFFRITGFEPHPRYYLENAAGYLDQPGEWHYDSQASRLTYWPLPHESPERVQALVPVAEQLLLVRGDAASGRWVRGLRFVGLELTHAAAPAFSEGYAGIQAGFHEPRGPAAASAPRGRMPAAVVFEDAQDCAFEGGRIRHTGGSALSLQGSCHGNRVEGNEIGDIGGNGVMVGEPSATEESVSRHNRVIHNWIFRCGQRYHGCVGIWVGIAADTMVAHNELQDLPYTGISVGWRWDTTPSPCGGNILERNHIHQVMQVLSDGGGIYTLGRQPGTVLRENLVHGVPLNAGRAESNGFFIDEGSSELLIERNTIYDLERSPIRFHKAQGNRLRENILVCAEGVPPFRYNATAEESMTYEGNVSHPRGQWTPPADGPRVAGRHASYRRRQSTGLDASADAFAYAQRLGRGINLGNALEAPREGDWGIVLEDDFFPIIAQAGFQSVRIPIRWSAHADRDPPYGVDEAFFERVDWAVETALDAGLMAVINVHHYQELFAQPAAHRERLTSIWRQIAHRYRTHTDRLVFELLNEPHDALDHETWNGWVPELLDTIRQSNPVRIVIVGPGQWNSVSHLPQLSLPTQDRRLIATFHYYQPFAFTHQGASWVAGSQEWLGTRWEGSEQQRQAVKEDLDRARQWSLREGRPLYLGEFGAFSRAPLESRARWTAYLREQAEQRGMAWAYWEFASGFGAYDLSQASWRSELRQALIPDPALPHDPTTLSEEVMRN